MFKRIYAKLTVSVVLVLFLSPALQAEQYVTRFHGKEVVVHTNPVPVFLHRLIPPNYGRHITVREYQTGRVPAFANGFVPSLAPLPANAGRAK